MPEQKPLSRANGQMPGERKRASGSPAQQPVREAWPQHARGLSLKLGLQGPRPFAPSGHLCEGATPGTGHAALPSLCFFPSAAWGRWSPTL